MIANEFFVVNYDEMFKFFFTQSENGTESNISDVVRIARQIQRVCVCLCAKTKEKFQFENKKKNIFMYLVGPR